jgi:hypothetical protein
MGLDKKPLAMVYPKQDRTPLPDKFQSNVRMTKIGDVQIKEEEEM